MFILIVIMMAYRLQQFFSGYCISNPSISFKSDYWIERRRWDSNLRPSNVSSTINY
jgi:hypothetical protein